MPKQLKNTLDVMLFFIAAEVEGFAEILMIRSTLGPQD